MTSPRPLALYALTQAGAQLTLALARGFLGSDPDEAAVRLFWPERLQAWAEEDPAVDMKPHYFERLAPALAENFGLYRGHVVVGATGIVVRAMAPLIVKKTSDPAVVVLGQDGRYAISLLSGHLGGGNALAQEAARITGGQAVITTATDLTDLPALEMLAREAHLVIPDYAPLAAISRTLVEGGRVNVCDPGNHLAPALAPWPQAFTVFTDPEAALAAGAPLVWVDHTVCVLPPETFILRPKSLVVAMGCHRGIEPEALSGFFYQTLADHNLDPRSVALLVSVETRAQEPALLALARELACPYQTYTKTQLAEVRTPNPSAKVLDHIGVESVCEAAALLASRASQLLIAKRKGDRATLAAAILNCT